jgi:hypothetical protein
MKNLLLIAFLFLFSWAVAQQVEPVRYEVSRWNKDQGCHFQTLGENDGIMINETDKTDKQKRRLWSFACVDSSLYETRNDLIPLPDKLKFIDSDSDGRFATFLFVNDGNKKASDTLDFLVVSFIRVEKTYQTFGTNGLRNRCRCRSLWPTARCCWPSTTKAVTGPCIFTI